MMMISAATPAAASVPAPPSAVTVTTALTSVAPTGRNSFW